MRTLLPRMAHPATPTIYFAQFDQPHGAIKIGYTRRPVRARMAEGQTFGERELIVLAETYVSRTDEAKLHRAFAHLNVRGEWFRAAPELNDLILYLALEEGSLQAWLTGVGG